MVCSTSPSESLRKAIAKDGRPIRRIAKSANVAASVITRFINRERGLTGRSLDRICGELGLELRPANR
jgi:plasmid maintenance system antidote protein VapI